MPRYLQLFFLAGLLLTDCLDSMSDWATAYMFSCRSMYTMKNANFGENSNLYMAENFVGRPGPLLNEDGTLQPATDSMVDCYIRGNGKACHLIGQVYLFGEVFHQGINMTDEEIAFAKAGFQIICSLALTVLSLWYGLYI